MKATIVLLNIWTVVFVRNVSATPNGAGSCAAGISAIETDDPTNRHIQYAGFPGSTETRPGKSGTLFEGATTATLNGEVLVPGSITTVPINTELVWEITAAQVAFKGLLVRVEKASDDFTLIGADDTLKNSELCDAFAGVSGVTHVNNEPKVMSSGTLQFTSGGAATLDITVVYDNTMTSIYAFNTFEIAVEGDEVPTSTPVITFPTPVPFTFSPTPAAPFTFVPTPVIPIAPFTPFPSLPGTPEPTKEKGMGMGMMKDMGMGMMKDGEMGMMKDGEMGMMKDGEMKKDGKEKGVKDGKEKKAKEGKEKGVKEGKNMDGMNMKMKKGSDDDEDDDEGSDDSPDTEAPETDPPGTDPPGTDPPGTDPPGSDEPSKSPASRTVKR